MEKKPKKENNTYVSKVDNRKPRIEEGFKIIKNNKIKQIEIPKELTNKRRDNELNKVRYNTLAVEKGSLDKSEKRIYSNILKNDKLSHQDIKKLNKVETSQTIYQNNRLNKEEDNEYLRKIKSKQNVYDKTKELKDSKNNFYLKKPENKTVKNKLKIEKSR